MVATLDTTSEYVMAMAKTEKKLLISLSFACPSSFLNILETLFRMISQGSHQHMKNISNFFINPSFNVMKNLIIQTLMSI